jgi:hypothetical protein
MVRLYEIFETDIYNNNIADKYIKIDQNTNINDLYNYLSQYFDITDKIWIDENNKVCVDVRCAVRPYKKYDMKKLPVSFGTVNGRFICRDMPKLETLEGSPEEVNTFDCSNTNITSLKHIPKIIHRDCILDDNLNLTSIDDWPLQVSEYMSFVGCSNLIFSWDINIPTKIGENIITLLYV